MKHGINVVCVTNRGLKYLPNILNNYKRQVYENKRLHIIFNVKVDEDDVKKTIEEYKVDECSISVYPDKTLGSCLNYSIKKIPEEYSIWAKMDDDDYYGNNYLLHNLEGMLKSKSQITGRGSIYVYIPERKKVVIKNTGGVSRYTNFVYGATLFVDKSVFLKIKFPSKNTGEDSEFLKNANKNKIKIYATTMNDFISTRHLDSKFHTWKTTKFFIGCRAVKIKLPLDYTEHVIN